MTAMKLGIHKTVPFSGVLLAVSAISALLFVLCFGSGTAYGANTTYYVNNLSGSNCSNAGPGTSTSAPWCDFTPVNSHGAFGPGDKILLARGATWNQQMTVTGQGTSTNLIELGAYGTGSRPIITRNGLESDRVIKITNPSYWNVHDLEISNAGSGIFVYFDTIGHEGLYFSNIYVHDITGIHQSSLGNAYTTGASGPADRIWNSGGIQVTGTVTLTSSTQYVLRTLRLDGIEGTNNLDSISLDFDNGGSYGVTLSGGAVGQNLLQDVIINHAYLHDDDNSAAGCDEGMRFDNINGGTVMNSIFDNEASCHSYSGTAAIFLGVSKNVTFVNNIMTNVPNTSSADMVAVDLEAATDSVRFRNNYIAGNAGAGLSYLAIWSDYSDNNEASGNLFQNNGNGSFRRAGNSDPTPPNGTIRDNLYTEPNNFLYQDGADYSGFTVTNNLSISSTSNAYHAASQFSGTQSSNNWSYQYNNGTTWTNLGYYDTAAKVWQLSSTTNVPQVSQFEQHPGTCANCAVARAWTAPTTGTISIRGRVLKSNLGGGDGIIARVTKNGTRIWPTTSDQSIAYNDIVGAELTLDNVSVTAGDIIRFEVTNGSSNDNTYDMTSWAPVVAYTSTGTTVAKQWDFNTDGNVEGWTMTNQIAGSVSGGILTLTSSGGDPYMTSADNLGIANASTNRYVKIRMKNNTSDTAAELFFTTTTDTTWTASKSVLFPTIANAGGYTDYIFDMGTNANWTGTIKQLRFDPFSVTGTMNVDSIVVTSAGYTSAKDWNFNTNGNLEGWTNGNQVSSMTVSGGSLNMTSTGTDPYVYAPDNLGIASPSTYRYLRIRLQNSTSSSYGEIYFITTSDTAWNSTKQMLIPIVPNSGYRDYVVDLGTNTSWTGTIKQVRLDPSLSSGDVNVDYFRLTN